MGVMASFLNRSYKYKPQLSKQQPTKRKAFIEHLFKIFNEIFNHSLTSFNEKKEARASIKGQIKKVLQRVSYLFSIVCFMLYMLHLL